MNINLTLEFVKEMAQSNLIYRQALLKVVNHCESLEEVKRVVQDALDDSCADSCPRPQRAVKPIKSIT